MQLTVLTPGDRLHTYRIARTLPSTRSGDCYEATHAVLPRAALIKVAHAPEHGGTALELLREVCILDALQHPGVPRVYDADSLAFKRPWFAREWLVGETAAALIARTAVTAYSALSIIRDLADTLAYVHHRGIIHGDLRAEAVLVTPNRAFGISIIDWSDAMTHDAARPSSAQGRHIAPEVRRGEVPDDRADVYALGVLAARLLMGHGTELSPLVTRTIRQMLAPDRFDRPSAAEVCAEITEHMDVTEAVAAIEPVATAPTPMPTDTTPLHARIRRPRWTPPIPVQALPPLPDYSNEIVLIDEEELA